MSDIFGSPSTAVITGAASGIGRAAAKRFAERGMRLCLFDVSEDALTSLASELPVETRIVAGDVSKPEDLAKLHDTAYTRLARPRQRLALQPGQLRILTRRWIRS